MRREQLAGGGRREKKRVRRTCGRPFSSFGRSSQWRSGACRTHTPDLVTPRKHIRSKPAHSSARGRIRLPCPLQVVRSALDNVALNEGRCATRIYRPDQNPRVPTRTILHSRRNVSTAGGMDGRFPDGAVRNGTERQRLICRPHPYQRHAPVVRLDRRTDETQSSFHSARRQTSPRWRVVPGEAG